MFPESAPELQKLIPQNDSDTLAGMNWKRGFVLAALHLIIAAILISWEESRALQQRVEQIDTSAASIKLVAWQDQQSFDPCISGFVDFFTTPAERIVQVTDLPAWVLIRWRIPCPPPWTVAGFLHTSFHLKPLQEDFVEAGVLLGLVPLVWIFVGGFPLVRLRWSWAEPGAVITICSQIAAALVPLDSVYRYGKPEIAVELLMLVAMTAWLWWLGLVIRKALRLGWHITSVSLLRRNH